MIPCSPIEFPDVVEEFTALSKEQAKLASSKQVLLTLFLTQKMEVVHSSKIMNFCQTTGHRIPDDSTFCVHSCENLKCYSVTLILTVALCMTGPEEKMINFILSWTTRGPSFHAQSLWIHT